MFKKIFRKKHLVLALLVAAASVGILLWQAKPAYAAIEVLLEGFAYLLGWLTQSVVIKLVTYLLAFLIGILVKLAQYNSIVDAKPVQLGWVVVRDISNMLFVIGLLYISFKTVFQGVTGESYKWSKSLANLVLMAILINFSRAICALAIDAAQVLMMTFVNAFKDMTAGNLQALFGMADFNQMQKPVEGLTGETAKATYSMAIAGYMGLIIISVICCVVVFAFVVVLMWRIVALWILVVLSPAAFALRAIDLKKTKEYADQWTQYFSRYLMVGPLMAFFLWLSFAAFTSNQQANSIITGGAVIEDKSGVGVQLQGQMGGAAMTPDNLGGLIVVIAFLVGGLAATQKLGVAGGKLGSDMVNKGQKFATQQATKAGKKAVTWPAGKAWGITGGAAYGAVARRASGIRQGWAEKIDAGADSTASIFTGAGLKSMLTKKGRERRAEYVSAKWKGDRAGTTELDVGRVKEKQLKDKAAFIERQGKVQSKDNAENLLESDNDAEVYAATNYLTENGLLTSKHAEKLRGSKLWKSLGNKQKIDFGRKWEKTNKKESGDLVAITDVVEDADTGEFTERDKDDEYNATRKHIGTAQKNEYVNVVGRSGFANVAEQTVGHVMAHIEGATDQTQKSGKLDPKDRKKFAGVLDYMEATETERQQLIDSGKAPAELKRKKGESESGYNIRKKSYDDNITEVSKGLKARGVDVTDLRMSLGQNYDSEGRKIKGGDNGGDIIPRRNRERGKMEVPKVMTNAADNKRSTDTSWESSEDAAVNSVANMQNPTSPRISNTDILAMKSYLGACTPSSSDKSIKLSNGVTYEKQFNDDTDRLKAIQTEVSTAQKKVSDNLTAPQAVVLEAILKSDDIRNEKNMTEKRKKIKIKIKDSAVLGGLNLSDEAQDEILQGVEDENKLKQEVQTIMEKYWSTHARNVVTSNRKVAPILPQVKAQVDFVTGSSFDQIAAGTESGQQARSAVVSLQTVLTAIKDSGVAVSPEHAAAMADLTKSQADVQNKALFDPAELAAFQAMVKEILKNINEGKMVI